MLFQLLFTRLRHNFQKLSHKKLSNEKSAKINNKSNPMWFFDCNKVEDLLGLCFRENINENIICNDYSKKNKTTNI